MNSCLADAATFPILRSREMEEKLLNFTSSAGNVGNFWIGLTYNNATNESYWDTGEVFMPSEYDHFNVTRFPDNSRSCSVIHLASDEWRNHFCLNFRHTVCMTWSSSIKPLNVTSTTHPNLDGIYYPENGMLIHGAPVYKQQGSDEPPYFLSRQIISSERE